MKIADLEKLTVAELRKKADELGLENVSELRKEELIIAILEKAGQSGRIQVEGVLDVLNSGSHGILRNEKLHPSETDVYVSGSQIKRFNLRSGDFITGLARSPKDKERYLSLLRVNKVNDKAAEKATARVSYEKLTPVFPDEQIILETKAETLSTRLIDLLSPVGKGQRGMIVSPPKAGKTWLLKDIAKGIAENHPDIELMVLLIGERPEEVTDMERSVKGWVVASNFDMEPESQTRISELCLERAKRLVEEGKDVVILMDSITRLARAYNMVVPPSGRTLTGGFDPVALYPPKKFFGAARNVEKGGSLTIVATALVDTGSRLDDVVFEEFKGTGNMELKLDRNLSEKRVYPSIDVKKSGTRNEELLLSSEVLADSWRVRRMLESLKDDEATQLLIERMKKTKTNKEFLATLHEAM